jgi:hypothetical protein
MCDVTLSNEALLGEAGSSRFGRVLIRNELGPVTVAVIDVNGDGALTASVVMHLGADGLWRQSEWGTSSVLTQGWIDQVRYACGRAWHVPSVEVALAERWLRVPVNTHGWWLFMAYADKDVALNLSRVPDPLT